MKSKPSDLKGVIKMLNIEVANAPGVRPYPPDVCGWCGVKVTEGENWDGWEFFKDPIHTAPKCNKCQLGEPIFLKEKESE